MAENKDEAQGNLIPTREPENKSTDAYGNLVRGLNSEELSQTGTQKLILNDLSKAEAKIKELEPFREKYYSVLLEKSVLEEKLSKTKRAEVLYSFCTAFGGVIIGLAKLYLEANATLFIIMIVIGVSLILGGILFKTAYKK
jgi:hypothetical protein